MRRNRVSENDYRDVADALSVPASEVRRAVQSFFDEIGKVANSLPFDNETKIYTKDKFSDFEYVWNIPCIGRIGPIYSRYLKWRENEAKMLEQLNRSHYRSRLTQGEIENIAEEILSGNAPSTVKRRKRSELFNRVWLVGESGKKSARQVIPKKVNIDVSDS